MITYKEKQMMTFRLMFILSVLFALFAGAVEARDSDNAEKLALAVSVVEATNAAVTVKRIIPILLEQQKRVFLSQNGGNVSEQQQREIELTLQFLAEELELIYPAFEANVAALYAKKFSENDLKAILAFYTSGVGKRFASGSTELSREIGTLGQEWMAKEALDAAKRARARAIEEASNKQKNDF
jgi:hypothetical protein